SNELVITLDEKIASGDTLTLKPNVLSESVCGLFIESQQITILPPVEAQTLVAVINAPSLLGECQDLIVESASYGYGELKYTWEYIDVDESNQYDLEIATLLSSLSDTTSSATIPAIYIEPGTKI